MRSLKTMLALLLASSCAPSASPPSLPPAVPTPSTAPPASAATIAVVSPSTAPTPSTPTISPGSVGIGQVVGPPNFDPGPALEGMKAALLKCYADARLIEPQLHGRLVLEVHVNAAGAVTDVGAKADTSGHSANDPGLVGCVGDALKGATFPKPGGLATISLPLVFRQ